MLKSLTDDSISFGEMAEILEKYPTIAARLIAIANSAWSSPVTEITTLEQACSRLGFNVVRSISIALAVASPFNPKRCPDFDAKFFWTSALMAADGASWFCQNSTSLSITPAEARAAGLMHNLGVLLLADQAADHLQAAIGLVEREIYVHLGDALTSILHFNHCDVGRVIGENWELPSTLVEAMSYDCVLKQNENAADLNQTALLLRLTCSVLSDMQNQREVEIPLESLQRLQIPQEDAKKICARMEKQLEKTREMAETLFKE